MATREKFDGLQTVTITRIMIGKRAYYYRRDDQRQKCRFGKRIARNVFERTLAAELAEGSVISWGGNFDHYGERIRYTV